MRRIEKQISRAAIALGWFSALTLVAITSLTFADVIGRNFFGRAVLGTVETISLLMGVLVFSGLAITEMNRRHIVVETFQNLFPKPALRLSKIVNALLAVFVAGLLLQQLFIKTRDVFAEEEFTMILKLPYWPAAILMLIGFGMFFVMLLLRLVQDTRSKMEPPHAD